MVERWRRVVDLTSLFQELPHLCSCGPLHERDVVCRRKIYLSVVRRCHIEQLEHRALLSASTDWGFQLGSDGSNSVDVDGVAVGTSGDVYVVGKFEGTVDFDPGPDVKHIQEDYSAAPDHFVAKYSSAGDYLWVRGMVLGGYASGGTWKGIAVDAQGGVYVSGWYGDIAEIGDDTLVRPDEYDDAFIAKFSTIGNFVWAENTNTSKVGDRGLNVAVDDKSSLSTAWSVYMTSESDELWKFDADTGDTLWIKEIKGKGKGQGGSESIGVAVDGAGDVYLTGRFWNTVYFDDIKLTEIAEGSPYGVSDYYVTRLDLAGNFLWAKQVDDVNNLFDGVRDIDVYDQNIYVTGFFDDTLRFDPGPDSFEITTSGGRDGFVFSLDTDGNFAWATSVGGADEDWALDLDVHQGDVYVNGHFSGMADFGADQLVSAGSRDGYVSRIDGDGNFVETWQIGGPSTDGASGVALDGGGNIHVVGNFGATADFPTGDTLTALGTRDGYVLKFSAVDPNNSPPTADIGGPYAGTEDGAISLDASGSSDPDLDALTYQWDFGDGTTLTTTSDTASHTYAWGGTFAVNLTVSDGRGGSDSASTTATVAEINDVPVADAGGPYSGNEGVAITLDASASSDFDNEDGTATNDQALEYTWDFGDGSAPVTTSSATTSYTYSTASTYNVSVTVSDGVASDTAFTTAVIATPPVGDPNDLYVWDIYFATRNRGRNTDLQILVDVNSDSNADGMASGSDAAAVGVLVTIELRNSSGNLVGTYTSTTNSAGVVQTGWIKNLADDDYTANVVDMALDGFSWDPLALDNEDDSDGDLNPDDVFAFIG